MNDDEFCAQCKMARFCEDEGQWREACAALAEERRKRIAELSRLAGEEATARAQAKVEGAS